MLHNVEIRRPRIEDTEEIHRFFDTVIKHTFAREGLSNWIEDIEDEIEDKKQRLQCDFDSNGKDQYFLMASSRNFNQIIGTIEYGPASDLIDSCTDGALKGLYEIGTVFVLPIHQRRGIGNLLLNKMFLTLLYRGIQEFCLDSGYSHAQKIWKKKFGAPDYLLKDYWGEGNHHMIWRKYTKDMPVKFVDDEGGNVVGK